MIAIAYVKASTAEDDHERSRTIRLTRSQATKAMIEDKDATGSMTAEMRSAMSCSCVRADCALSTSEMTDASEF